MTDETTMQILRIFNAQNQYEPTQAQVDKILLIQEKGLDYAHQERMRVSPKQKIELVLFLAGLFVLVLIFVLCLLYAKEYLGEIVSGIVGLVAGVLGGYGYGKSQQEAQD
jgi:hypothetical protein